MDYHEIWYIHLCVSVEPFNVLNHVVMEEDSSADYVT